MKRYLMTLMMSLGLLILSGCAVMDRGPRPEPMTVNEIISLSRSGNDANTIISEIKRNGVEYDITASQLSQMSRDGVPDQVIDFIHRTQLDLARRDARNDALRDAWFYNSNWGVSYRPYIFHRRGRLYVRYW